MMYIIAGLTALVAFLYREVIGGQVSSLLNVVKTNKDDQKIDASLAVLKSQIATEEAKTETLETTTETEEKKVDSSSATDIANYFNNKPSN